MNSALFLFLVTSLFLAGQRSSPGQAPAGLSARKPAVKEKASITRVLFGEIKGEQVYEYTLKNSKGMMVKVINYGATITDIISPDKNGELQSVVLGFDSLSGYTGPTNAVLGAAVGRVANRIANKKFTLDGREYVLTSNIHGGLQGFSKRLWNIEEIPGKQAVGLRLTYFSKDGEEGFPGNVNATIVYTLTRNNELKINYSATTDRPTPVVLTNHTYFNLSGGRDDKALNTELMIAADRYLESGAGGMPTGKFVDVKGTPYDFTVPRKIGERINDDNEQLKRGNGYDIAYALRNQTGRLAFAARAYEPMSGRVLEVYTTEPGVIFYTANYVSERLIGRGGKPSTKNSAFCLETQHYPDSPNQPQFPNTILRPGETFRSQTVFRFSARK
jgi:aldose 1-epimerase